MSRLVDPRGQPIRSQWEEQATQYINLLAKRQEGLQAQLLEVGLMVEFMWKKLTAGDNPTLSVTDEELGIFMKESMQRMQEEARQMMEQQKAAVHQTQLDLSE